MKSWKENRRSRVRLSCQKEDLNEKGNPGEQLRTNGSVHEGVCMCSENPAASAGPPRVNCLLPAPQILIYTLIRYKAKRMR